MIERSFKEILDSTGLSLSQIGEIVKKDKSTLSRMASGEYPNYEERRREVIDALLVAGVIKETDALIDESLGREYRVNPETFIRTQNVVRFDDLANGLLEPDSTLNSSIGIVLGPPGYGKTFTARHYASVSPDSAYVLYMKGFTLTYLMRQIANTLTGVSFRTYHENLALIKEATALRRKLIIIDEADRLPIRYIEALRGLNEYCSAPVVLIGEESLHNKMRTLPRLESRVRREIVFDPLSITDVALFYAQAVGENITDEPQLCKELLSRARKDFRNLVNDAITLCQAMTASGLNKITKSALSCFER